MSGLCIHSVASSGVAGWPSFDEANAARVALLESHSVVDASACNSMFPNRPLTIPCATRFLVEYARR
eukprot:2134724-Lingulodinium_polyedra.AAC.1